MELPCLQKKFIKKSKSFSWELSRLERSLIGSGRRGGRFNFFLSFISCSNSIICLLFKDKSQCLKIAKKSQFEFSRHNRKLKLLAQNDQTVPLIKENCCSICGYFSINVPQQFSGTAGSFQCYRPP